MKRAIFMKTLAIYFSDPGMMGYPFNKQEYFDIYREIVSQLSIHNIRTFFVRGPQTYLGHGRWSYGSFFDMAGDLREHHDVIHADLIFNRDHQNNAPEFHDVRVINKPAFDRLCLDKYLTYSRFPDLSPKTAQAFSFDECLITFRQWKLKPEEKIVLKKNFETEGRGVHVLTTHEITSSLYENWDHIIIQEFLDSSVGIPGIVSGLHDLRVTVINGEPINSFVRVPKPGSFLANISQGGTGTSLPLDQVPREVIGLISRIDQKLIRFVPRIYSADFMNSPHGYKLVELNSRPGVQHPHWSSTYQHFNNGVVKMLVEALS